MERQADSRQKADSRWRGKQTESKAEAEAEIKKSGKKGSKSI
jgi:hypothetical protein